MRDNQTSNVINPKQQMGTTPRGLSTIAFLKARKDHRQDHRSIFMPLLEDAISTWNIGDIITVAQVQAVIVDRHDGVALPTPLVEQLFGKAVRKGILRKENILFYVKEVKAPDPAITSNKKELEEQIEKLAAEFLVFAKENGHPFDNTNDSLNLIFNFLVENDTAVLLNSRPSQYQFEPLSLDEQKLIAHFIENNVIPSPELSSVLNRLMEGLVVYKTAYLTDFDSSQRSLEGMQAYLDTRFLFQVLGYEGKDFEIWARENLRILQDARVLCRVFESTIKEMRNILGFYERLLGEPRRVTEARPQRMLAYFLKHGFRPSDIAEASSLVAYNLADLGVTVTTLPRRLPNTTLDEKKLADMLADPNSTADDEPRVNHDVDCIAGILTIRQGTSFSSLARATSVFATTSLKTMRVVDDWYFNEGGSGISPIVSVRAITNLAWLRNPAAAANLKLHELVILCSTVLRPSQEVWLEFINHLRRMNENKTLSNDKMVAIVLTELTENHLSDLETFEETADGSPITMADIVDRVQKSISSEAENRIVQITTEADQRISKAELRADELHTTFSNLRGGLEARCDKNAKTVGRVTKILIGLVIILAGTIGVADQFEKSGWLAFFCVLGTVILLVLGLLTSFDFINRIANWAERLALSHYRRKFMLAKPREPEPEILSLLSETVNQEQDSNTRS